jgi:CRP/FNR family cyclic AMP-dependent transcriptional regulator
MNSPYGLPTECLTCVLRPDKFFCALSEESVQAFSQIKHAAVYPEDAIVLVEGQSPHGIFILCPGQAKLSTTSRDRKTIILRIVSPGEVLGLHAVVSGKPSEVTVETMQPSQLSFVNRADFLRFLKEHSDACLRAVQHIRGRSRQARAHP